VAREHLLPGHSAVVGAEVAAHREIDHDGQAQRIGLVVEKLDGAKNVVVAEEVSAGVDDAREDDRGSRGDASVDRLASGAVSRGTRRY
jgi:hypothetical protein